MNNFPAMTEAQRAELIEFMQGARVFSYTEALRLKQLRDQIALAALTAEPVAYTDAEELETLRKGTFADMFTPHEAYKADPLWMPIFTAPPAPVLRVPDGWKLVPIEPTEDMVIRGFESKPDQFWSTPEEWAEYEAMSGCQQAAHKATLCWHAMLAAAPEVE